MFAEFIGNLNTLGFYDFLLPFMFVMALTFGLLTKSAVFGNNAAVYGILSISIAFFSINYTPIGLFLTRSMTYAAVFIAGVMILILMLGIFGGSIDAMFSDGIMWFIAFMAVLIFISAGGGVIFDGISSLNMSLILMGIVLLSMIFVVGVKK